MLYRSEDSGQDGEFYSWSLSQELAQIEQKQWHLFP